MAGDDRADTSVLRGKHWLTRVLFLRCLGFVYMVAFFVALKDNGALLGEDGLLPATLFMEKVQHYFAALTLSEKMLKLPTIFWFVVPTAANLRLTAAVGAGVSSVVAWRGAANLPAMALLWALYFSIVNVGQTWYSFGWESQLLETGFVAMFLVPWLSLSRFPLRSPTPLVCVWAYRWLLFRIMLGAGLIKMRGDACWQDLTCMEYHYQTQPNPNPLSLYLHHLPGADWHKAEVMVNHIVELVLPWGLLLGRRCRRISGLAQIMFQVAIIVSGNLSFLNWLTAVPAIFSFDDLYVKGLFSHRCQRLAYRLAVEEKATVVGGGDGGGGDGGVVGGGGVDDGDGGVGGGVVRDGDGGDSSGGRGNGGGSSSGGVQGEVTAGNGGAGSGVGGPEIGGGGGGGGAGGGGDSLKEPLLLRCADVAQSKQQMPTRGGFWSGALRTARRLPRWAANLLLVGLVLTGSDPVVRNMAGMGEGQTMNRSFGSLRIVNTYGNFGSVTKTRGEVVLKGTRSPNPQDPKAEWKEYDFKCKPGDVNQTPCVITPFHNRLDWQMWFAAFQNYGSNPWLVNLTAKLLSRDDNTRALAGSLLRHDPFAPVYGGGGGGGEGEGEGGSVGGEAEDGDGKQLGREGEKGVGRGGGSDSVTAPPLFIKADLYVYEFTPPGTWPLAGGERGVANGEERGRWWTRRLVREYLPPVSLETPSLHGFLRHHGLA